MSGRTLGTSYLIPKDELDPFNRNIPKPEQVREAVEKISAELKDMASRHHPAGWSEEGNEVVWNITGVEEGNIVLGTLRMTRPD